MACNSRENTISHLKQLGVLDEFGLVTDTSRLDKINQHYLDYVNNTLGISSTEVLLPYKEVKSTTLAGHTKYKYVLEPNVTLFEKIDEKINEEVPVGTEEDFFDAPMGTVTPLTPEYGKTIKFKESLARGLERRLEKIKADKKKYSADPVRLKELTRLQNVLETRLEGSSELQVEGLRDEIAALKAAPALDVLEAAAARDFARLDTLVNSNDPNDIKEANRIIKMYEEMGTFDPESIHPLFYETRTLIQNGQPKVHYVNTGFDQSTGEVVVDPAIVSLLASWKEKVQEPKNKLFFKSRQLFVEGVNTNRKVQRLYNQPLTYEELTHQSEGLKDTPWIDMFMMDVTNGVFSTNGIIPQVMMNMLQNSFESHLVYAKTVEERVDGMKKNLEAALRSLKASHDLDYDLAGKLKILGLTGVSYDLFKAEDKNGLFKDGIVQRYDAAYIEERNKMFNTFRSDLENAKSIADPVRRDQKITGAYNKRKNWYKKHTIVVDVRKVPSNEINNSRYGYTQAEQEAYKQELIDVLGEQGYQEEIAKQEKMMKEYQTMLEVVTETIAAEGGTPAEQNAKVQKWVKRNNPFDIVANYYDDTPLNIGQLKFNPTMRYNYAIPRRTKVRVNMQGGSLTITPTQVPTGYYNKKFEIIEENDDLKEFHNLLMEVQQKMMDTMPPDVRKKFNATSLPTLQKNLMEILSDPNRPFYVNISKAARYLYDKIRAMFGINIQSSLSHAEIDPETGRPEYQVSDEFLNSNKEEINKRYQIELLRLKNALGIPLTQKLSGNTVYNLHTMNQEAISIIAEALGVDPNVQAIMDRLPGENPMLFEPGRIVRSGITHQVVQEKSFDLPKIMKLYSYLTMEYAARQEILPLMGMMRSHYEEIKKPEVTNTGATVTNSSTQETSLEGLRTNANKQMESWFNRAVLGHYGSQNEFGDTTLKRHIPLALTNSQKMQMLTSKLRTTLTGRILNKEEKLMQSKIPDLLEALEAQINRPGITPEEQATALALYERLKKNEEKIGKTFSFTAAFDALFNFIRFKGLGWNLSSYVTNYMEGQIANMIIAASGDYFPPENIYRATDIVKGSFFKFMTGGKAATQGAKKARILMDRYRILQDASNELQKASSKTAFSQFKKLDPYYGTHRTEYMNQAPLMIAVLMDVKVTGKDGTVSSVWDAMNSDGILKDNFATSENQANWEQANGGAYNDFASHIKKTIVNAHGDYDELRGNMASERITGKALLMFKRWMGRQFYQRFATEQPDLEVGIKNYRGRYYSHTSGSGALHGAIVGFGFFGIVGAGVGAAGGYLLGKGRGANTNIGFLRELAFTSKELFLTLVGLPVNYVAGKAVIRMPQADGQGLNERDTRNFQANMVDISMQLAWLALLLFTKATLWDDEDESVDSRRQAHNFLANRFMQLSSQASMYSNPVETYNSITSLPIMQFFKDIGKVLTEAQDFFEGEDTLAGGANAGESALGNQLKKTFFPGIIKSDKLGFEKHMERQFRPSAFDTWFHSDEKKAKKVTQGIRASYLLDLIEDGMGKDEAKKKVKKKYRSKKRGEKETYQDLLEHYESLED